LLVNPWAVLAALESASLAESTMLLMVAMLPIAILILIAFIAVTVLISFAAIVNERRLIRLIQRCGMITGNLDEKI